MKKNLTIKEIIILSSMLFGMFFGAGNLIFPIHMGQLSGSEVLGASLGFIITGVGLPLLSIAVLGYTKCEGVLELTERVGKRYSLFFTVLLYLTIGPFFAIPRCASVSYTIGVSGLIGDNKIYLFVFSLVFFLIVLFFSLKPSGIMDVIGKFINPLFLILLFIFIIASIIKPMGDVNNIVPAANYNTFSKSFFSGFLEGYNTMDILAGLAFGIVVTNAIKNLGINSEKEICKNTVLAGIGSSIIMGIIYIAISFLGSKSMGVTMLSDNGGVAFVEIATYYFKVVGKIILAFTVTFACLKTSIGLVISCGEMFTKLLKNKVDYKVLTVIFTLFSFIISNVGLNVIVSYSIPVLMFLYPLSIMIIILGFCENIFKKDRFVYRGTISICIIFAIFDMLRALPSGLKNFSIVSRVNEISLKYIPFSDLGIGWVIPSLMGMVVLIIYSNLTFKQKSDIIE